MERFYNETDCLLSLVDHVEIQVDDDVDIRNSDSEQTITKSENCFFSDPDGGNISARSQYTGSYSNIFSYF